jgi:hypothetical protein
MDNGAFPVRQTIPQLQHAIKRRSYCIESLQKKLDAQRAENFILQTNCNKLQAALFSLLEVWRDMQNASQSDPKPSHLPNVAPFLQPNPPHPQKMGSVCQQTTPGCNAQPPHHITSPQHPTPTPAGTSPQHPTPIPAGTSLPPISAVHPEMAPELALLQSVYISEICWWTSESDIRSTVAEALGITPYRLLLQEHKPNGKLVAVFVDVPTTEDAHLLIAKVNGKLMDGKVWKAEFFGELGMKETLDIVLADVPPILEKKQDAPWHPHHITSQQHPTPTPAAMLLPSTSAPTAAVQEPSTATSVSPAARPPEELGGLPAPPSTTSPWMAQQTVLSGLGDSADQPRASGFVCDLSWWTTEEDMRAVLRDTAAKEVPYNAVFEEYAPNGKASGNVFLDVLSEGDAPEFVDALHGRVHQGKKVTAEMSSSPSLPPPSPQPPSPLLHPTSPLPAPPPLSSVPPKGKKRTVGGRVFRKATHSKRNASAEEKWSMNSGFAQWFDGISQTPPKALNHEPIWKANAKDPFVHSCAPPPGWTIVDGITVPPINAHMEFMHALESQHSIPLWFCTPCYLDPAERFPDFEMCASCAETFYFPSPVAVPSSWTCPGCQELAAGNLAAAQHCHRCGKIEKVIQRVDELQRNCSCPFCLGQGCAHCCPCPFCFGEGCSHC